MKRRPVGYIGVAAAVLAVGDVAIDQRGLNGREFVCAHIFLAEQLVNRLRACRGEEHPLRILPAIALHRTAADEDRARRTHRYQFVRVYRHIVGREWPGILQNYLPSSGTRWWR